MSLHKLFPLVAFLLNVSLAGISLLRNPGSRLNRVFAYFVSAMAVWNFGVFMLRRTSEASTAHEWEVLIHAGIILVPAFYYHFVLIFLDRTSQNRGSLFLAYFLALVFLALNFGTSSAFITASGTTTGAGCRPRARSTRPSSSTSTHSSSGASST